MLYCFPGSSEVQASACNVENLGLIPGSGRSPGEGNDNPPQYSCLENPMDGGAWWATVHGVAKSWTRQSDLTSLLHSECGAIVAGGVSGKWNRMGGRDCKVYEEDFGHDEYVYYLDCSDGCMGIYMHICQNLSEYTFWRYSLYHMRIILQWSWCKKHITLKTKCM